MTEKILVFDMDGTIADLYGVDNWLDDLQNDRVRPYKVCKPIYDTQTMNDLIARLKEVGYKIIITTWLAMNSTKEYKREVRKAKLNWLDEIGFNYDEIHLVQYGTTKADCTRKYKNVEQILVDDNEEIRKGWHLGRTINEKKDILKELEKLLKSA